MNNLEFLGRGTQGTVYKIDSTKCIKLFKKKSGFEAELHTLLIGQIDSHFPRLYAYGDQYIVREYIKGIALDDYLSSNNMDEKTASKIIELYKSMKYVGYRRLDSALFHIFLDDDKIRLIDTAKAMRKDRIYPEILIRSLDKLGCREYFLDYVKKYEPSLYKEWINVLK